MVRFGEPPLETDACADVAAQHDLAGRRHRDHQVRHLKRTFHGAPADELVGLAQDLLEEGRDVGHHRPP